MRILVLATVLLVSSSLSPARAQEPSRDTLKTPQATPQATPAPPERNAAPPRDQHAEHDRAGGYERDGNRDGRMHRGGGQMGQGDRDMGPGMMMQRDRAGGYEREVDRDGDKDRGRYGDRDDRSGRRSDRADQGRYDGYGRDEDAPRRRVKICIEYDNGDEYCRDHRR